MIPPFPPMAESPIGILPVVAPPADAATAPFAPMLLDVQSGIGRATLDVAPASALPVADATPLIDAPAAPPASLAPPPLAPSLKMAKPAVDADVIAAAKLTAPAEPDAGADAPVEPQAAIAHLAARAGLRAPVAPTMDRSAAAVGRNADSPDPVDAVNDSVDADSGDADTAMNAAPDDSNAVLPVAVFATPPASSPPTEAVIPPAASTADQGMRAGVAAPATPKAKLGTDLAPTVSAAEPATDRAADATADHSAFAAVPVDASNDPVDSDITDADIKSNGAPDDSTAALPVAVFAATPAPAMPNAVAAQPAAAPLAENRPAASASVDRTSVAGLTARSMSPAARSKSVALADADAPAALGRDDETMVAPDAGLASAAARGATAPVSNMLQMLGIDARNAPGTTPTGASNAPTNVATASAVRSDLTLDVTAGDAWIAQVAADLARLKAPSDALHFRLHPAHLGALDVAVSRQDGQTSLILGVETAAAQRLFAESRPQLFEAATANAVDLKDVRIDLSAHTGGQPDNGQFGRRANDPETTRTLVRQRSDNGDKDQQESASTTPAPARGVTYRFA